MLVVYQTVFES